VTAAGEIDVQTAVGLGQAVQESLPSSSRLVIDLSRVTFIDSTGLGALIDARKRAVANGGSVSLVKPPDLVRRILAGTQLQHVLPVFETLRAALDALDAS
jgi:anti-anti-sigma factor